MARRFFKSLAKRQTNLGSTSIRCRPAKLHPMREFDSLPPELRAWVTRAALPWGIQSVKAAYKKALRQLGSPDLALKELDRLEAHRIATEADQVWGPFYPLPRGHSNVWRARKGLSTR